MRRRSSANPQAHFAVAFGLLSVALLPGAVALSHWTDVTLLQAAIAIPFALLAGFGAVLAARRARELSARTIGRVGGLRAARWGKSLGVLGLCLGAAAAIAVGFYGLLTIFRG